MSTERSELGPPIEDIGELTSALFEDEDDDEDDYEIELSRLA
jgi:hypothetical protein